MGKQHQDKEEGATSVWFASYLSEEPAQVLLRRRGEDALAVARVLRRAAERGAQRPDELLTIDPAVAVDVDLLEQRQRRHAQVAEALPALAHHLLPHLGAPRAGLREVAEDLVRHRVVVRVVLKVVVHPRADVLQPLVHLVDAGSADAPRRDVGLGGGELLSDAAPRAALLFELPLHVPRQLRHRRLLRPQPLVHLRVGNLPRLQPLVEQLSCTGAGERGARRAGGGARTSDSVSVSSSASGADRGPGAHDVGGAAASIARARSPTLSSLLALLSHPSWCSPPAATANETAPSVTSESSH